MRRAACASSSRPRGHGRQLVGTARARILPSSYRQVPATWPSTRNVGYEGGIFDVEHQRPIRLGQHLGAPRVHEKDRVPGRQETDGRRRVRIGQRRVLDVDELRAVLGRKRRSPCRRATACTGETFIPMNDATSPTDAGPKAAR